MKLLVYLLLMMLGGAMGVLAMSLLAIGKRADEEMERMVRSAGWQ